MTYNANPQDLIALLRTFIGDTQIVRAAREAADVIEQQAARIAELEARSTGPVAWRIEHRPGRYTFTEHKENLKLNAGANIVPLHRTFHSVDATLDSTLDRLESMVTWEPRLLTGPDAIDRLEHINRLLYELLNPHPAAPKLSTETVDNPVQSDSAMAKLFEVLMQQNIVTGAESYLSLKCIGMPPTESEFINAVRRTIDAAIAASAEKGEKA